MASDNEHPGTTDPPTRNKFDHKTQLAELHSHPALKSILDSLGDAQFDAASFAETGDYQLPDDLAGSLREEAGRGGLDHEVRPPATARILRSLANLTSIMFQQAKEGADKDGSRLPGVLVKQCTEGELHQTNGSHAYAILPLNGPAVAVFVSQDKKKAGMLRLRIVNPACSASPNRLTFVYVHKRGTQFVVQRVPGTGKLEGPLKYLLFSEDLSKPQHRKVAAKRSFAAIEHGFQSAEKERVRLISVVISALAEEKTLTSGNAAANTLLLCDACWYVLVGRRLFFDDSALWSQGNRKVAETAVHWIRDADVGRLFAIEGDIPWSIADYPSNIASCCVRFLDAVQHNGSSLMAIGFFDRRDVAEAVDKLFGELDVPQELLLEFEKHTKQATDEGKYEWLVACLYLIAVCKFISRSSPVKSKVFDLDSMYDRLAPKDSELRQSFVGQGPVRAFFLRLAAHPGGTESKDSADKKPRVAKSPHPKRDEVGETKKAEPEKKKKEKKKKNQPKKTKKQQRKQKTVARFFDEQADDDSDDECSEVDESGEDDYGESNSFIDDDPEEVAGEEEIPPNPYMTGHEVSEDDGVSHVSGTDEEDMGKQKPATKKTQFTTPSVKKPAKMPDAPARQQEKKAAKAEGVKQETGTKRKLQIVYSDSEEEEERRSKDKKDKQLRLEAEGQGTQQEKKDENRTTLLTRALPANLPANPPANLPANTLEIADVDMPLVHKPPLKQPLKGPAADSVAQTHAEPIKQAEPAKQQPVPNEQYESKIPCSVFPFDDLERKLSLHEVFELKSRWAKESVSEDQQFFDIFRDHRMIEYQRKFLRKRLEGLVNNDSKKLGFQQWADEQTHECWLVRFKGPSEWAAEVVKQDPAIKEKIVKFETVELGLNPITCQPAGHVLGVQTTVVSLGDPANQKGYFNSFLTYCVNDNDALRISPLAVMHSGGQYVVRTVQYGSDLRNRLCQIKPGTPCTDGGFGFRNIYLLFVRKDKKVETSLKETFGSIALSIERFRF